MGRGRQQRRELRADQPGLALLDDHVGFGDIPSSVAQALHFPAHQHQAGFIGVFDEVVVPGAPIEGDDAVGVLLVFLLAHGSIIGGRSGAAVASVSKR